ncbi:MAG: tetratricopeptide repeat protein [Candidatus Aminicenantes bacterium]|nr:MAG: tetratricopeptide repeat protein [Candidatus Aminicenantes bacterium]
MRKQVVFFGLFIGFFLVTILCPGNDIKEIESRLTGTVGKERIQRLSEAAQAYRDKEPKKTLEYGKEALKLLRTFPDRKLEIVILNHMSTASILMGDFRASARYAGKSRTIAQKINDKIGEADAIYNLGRTYWNQGRYKETSDCCSQAKEIYLEMGDQKGLANVFRLMSDIYWKKEEFSRAREYIQKSHTLYEALGDQGGIADLKNISGIISIELGEYWKGLSYFSEANQIYEALDDQAGAAQTFNNIGFTYCRMGKPSEALEYYNKSLEICQRMGSRKLISTVYNSIGQANAQMEQHWQALNYFSASLKINQDLDDSMGIAYNLIQMGKCKRKLGQYREARQLLERALEIARKINIKNEIKSASQELSEILETLGDHQKALAYYQEYKEVDEAIFNEKSRKKILEIQRLYETDKKEKEFQLLKKDRQLQQLKLVQQGNIRKSFILIVLLILLLAVLIYTRSRSKEKAARALGKEIEEHKRTAGKLRESEEKFRTLAEKSVVGICIIRDNVIQYANPAFLSIFGYLPGEIMGQSFLKLVIAEERSLVEERLKQRMMEDNSMNSRRKDFTGKEFRGVTKEGNVLCLDSYSVRTGYQGQAAVLKTVIDITERKKVEAELQKIRKLESVGTLAGSVAHDFKNLLSSISKNAQKLKNDVKHTPHIYKMIGNIEKTSLKATDLAQKLIIFSEGGGAALGKVTLSSILKNTIDMYPQMQKLIRTISISPDLTSIYGDEEKLSQVISNLLWNAEGAKTDHKDVAVTIAAENITLSPGNNASLKPGKYIKISFTDNGKGIPSHQLDKVFDPYFSTKDTFQQKGMGLGLAICYSLIKKQNGHISIQSEVGKGTTVELILPAYNEPMTC